MANYLTPHVSLEEAARHLKYRPETGELIRLRGRGAGLDSGRVDGKGYRQVGLCGVRYMAHRLAWWFHHGEWPSDQIDHVNGDKLDNRIANLEVVDQGTNLLRRGKRKDNTSGHVGVAFHKATGKWMAYIGRGGRLIHLGLFSDKAEAIAARQLAVAEAQA